MTFYQPVSYTSAKISVVLTVACSAACSSSKNKGRHTVIYIVLFFLLVVHTFADTSIRPGRPRVSGGCVSRVEFSAGIRQGYPVAPCIPPETEADPVQRLFCQLNLAFDGLLVTFRLQFCTVPLQQFTVTASP